MKIMKCFKSKLKTTIIYKWILLYRRCKELFDNEIITFRPISSGITKKQYCNHQVIISLTSYGDRLGTVYKTIYTLMNQECKANKIILWLSEDDYKRVQWNSKELLSCINKGLTILPCEDIKSYKKHIYALRDYSDCIILTADDDLLYPRRWLKKIISAYLETPNMIICNMVQPIKIQKDGRVLIDSRDVERVSSYLNRPLTGGGALFPPNCLCEDVFDKSIFMSVAPTEDDLWIWAMAVRSRMKIRMINDKNPSLVYVSGTQDSECLWKINGEKKANEVLNKLCYIYPEIWKIICDEEEDQI